ncbi:unnamed protein product [Spirodela intermedia]|uniref:Uncharacterized protein n=1 Tax=Spirodela intermedia TaxID=51605 RepID=A0A7I8K9E4_SPIIN|nr:unnamed protein product [Spirodela intermedia]
MHGRRSLHPSLETVEKSQHFEEMGEMLNNQNRIMRLREFYEPADSKIQPQIYGNIEANMNFKLDSTDTHAYLYDFVEKCDSHNIAGVNADVLKMRIFSHTLSDKVKDWFRTMATNIIEKLVDSCAYHQELSQNGWISAPKCGGLLKVSTIEPDIWRDKVEGDIGKVGQAMEELTKQMKNMMNPSSNFTSFSPISKPSFLCSICESYDHTNDICPTLEQVNAFERNTQMQGVWNQRGGYGNQGWNKEGNNNYQPRPYHQQNYQNFQNFAPNPCSNFTSSQLPTQPCVNPRNVSYIDHANDYSHHVDLNENIFCEEEHHEHEFVSGISRFRNGKELPDPFEPRSFEELNDVKNEEVDDVLMKILDEHIEKSAIPEPDPKVYVPPIPFPQALKSSKNEIMKWLKVGFIYAISNSPWS